MRCSQLENRLNDLLDRREDPSADPEIAAHTATCRRCRRVTAAYVLLADGAAALADDADACVALHDEPDSRSSPRFSLLRGATAAAWTVAAALLLYFTTTTDRGTATKSSPPIAATPIARDAVQLSPLATPSTRPVPAMIELTHSTGRLYLDLLHDTARGVDGALSLAASVPPAGELLEPVLYADGTLLRAINEEWLPAADATLDALEQVFTADAPVRS